MPAIKDDISDERLIEISKLIEEQMKKLMTNADYGMLGNYNEDYSKKKIPVLWKKKPETEKPIEDMYSITKKKYDFTLEDLVKSAKLEDYAVYKKQEDAYEAKPIAFNPDHYIDKLSITLK